MKNAKYNNRHKSAKRRKNKKKTTQNIDLSFAIQMIALALVLYYVAFGVGTTPVVKDSTLEVPATEAVAEPMVVSEEEPAVAEAATEPHIIIDENALPLEIHQIDVSCANAYLIRYDNFTIFADGGQSFAYDEVVDYLDNFGVTTIDCYIATHWHMDHVANMVDILNNYGHERTIVYGPSQSASGKYYVPKGTYTQMTPGTNFEIGDVGFICVGPDEVTQNGTVNPESLNILVQYKDFKFLMTGDYMKDSVLNTYGELVKDIDVLQMPHHGLSPFCISEGALSYCSPSTILVPADASKATQELVANLELDAKVFDNTNGCIAVVSYGNGYNVYTNVTTPSDLK